MDETTIKVLRGLYYDAMQAWYDKTALEREAELKAQEFSRLLQRCMDNVREYYVASGAASVTVSPTVGRGLITGFSVAALYGEGEEKREDLIDIELVEQDASGRRRIKAF